MSTCPTLYQSLDQFVISHCRQLDRWSQKRLVWFVFGVLVSQSVIFCRIAQRLNSVLPHSTKVESGERRLRRLAKDPSLNWSQAYRPAVQAVLAKLTTTKRVFVLVDETAQTQHYRLLMAALWYRGRAIPLAWHLRPAKAGQFWQAVEQVLRATAEVLPPQVEVIVMADRAFGSPAFTDLVTSLGWEWLVRLQGQSRFRHHLGQESLAREWLSGPGQRQKGRGELFKSRGWRIASLVALWHQPHQEPLLLGTSLPAEWEVGRYYKYRYTIESLFRDGKSRGFRWEGSQVRSLAQAEKVVLGWCWGLMVATVLGEQVAEEELARPATGQRHTRPPQARFSLVYQGLERVQSYLVGKVTKPLEWQLAHYEAERWSRQIHQHHAQAFIATSVPLGQEVAV